MKTALKIILPLLVLVLGVGATATMVAKRPQVKPEPREVPLPLVRTVTVSPQEHQYRVLSQGSVLPRTDIKLVTEVPGRVVAVAPSFTSGGFFNEGDVLVQLDRRDYELALVRARSALAEAQVRLQRELAEADIARKEWESLGGKGQANPLLLREPQLAEAKAAIASAEANVTAAELELDRCQVRAPFDGRIWNKNVDLGQYLAKGEAIARIYAVDYAEIRLPIPLDELAYLALPSNRQSASNAGGPEVIFRANFGRQTEEWRGHVVRTEGEIDSRTRMLNVVARVNDPYGRNSDKAQQPLAVGLFVEAEILGKSASQVFIVPRAAIRGRNEIKLVDEENRLRLRPVEIARVERDTVIVTAGLQPGEQVCISPLDTPVDGMRVRVSTPEQAAVTRKEQP
ncbi:MAG: efflux RND transporter periplasmic adaptor subunit [Limisphaerales bacterium]